MQITIDGEAFDLVNLDTLDFGEQRMLKRLTGGMGIEAITAGLETMDPDAWFGLILFSIRRVRPDFQQGILEKTNFLELIQSLEASIDQMRVDAAAAKEATGSVVPLSAPDVAEPVVEAPSQNGSDSQATRVLHGLPA